MTTPTAPHPAAVALPAGAVYVDDWYHPDQLVGDPPSNGEPGSLRYFTGSEWTVERPEPYNADISVQLDGNQYADGPIERFIVLDSENALTPAYARQLIAVLTEAVDEADLMAQQDQAVTR